MIVVMKRTATPDAIQQMARTVEEMGLKRMSSSVPSEP